MNKRGYEKNETQNKDKKDWVQSRPLPLRHPVMCVSTSQAEQKDWRVASIPDFNLDSAACFDNLNNTLRAKDFCHIIWKEPHKKMINEHLGIIQLRSEWGHTMRGVELHLPVTTSLLVNTYLLREGKNSTFCDQQSLPVSWDLRPTGYFVLKKIPHSYRRKTKTFFHELYFYTHAQ
jgi:hypothetical protein